MVETITETFRPEDLPDWAQKYPEVVALAAQNLSYRCDAFRARTRQYQRLLIRIARQAAIIIDEERNIW
jgi:predicted RNA-binding Zn ribbon-like protein